MAKAGTGNGDDLIGRNRALLTRAAATWAYAAVLFEETAETVLTAHLTQLRAWLLVRRRRALRSPPPPPGPA
jgi:hypothetical protein